MSFALSASVFAEDTNKPWDEYDKIVNSRSSLAAIGPTIFGDSVDLYSGQLSFSVTDISIPGNSALPVELTRTYRVSRKNGFTETSNGVVIGTIADGAMTDWEIDTPHLSTVATTTWRNNRCTTTASAGTVNRNGTYFNEDDYWHGYQANMPGGGELLVADQGAPKPSSGGPYPWMTSSFTYFSCLTNLQNGEPGEGFLAITSDGTKYRFDKMAQFFEPDIDGASKNGATLVRRRNVLYATRVEDRFGNWVDYHYSNLWNEPGRLSYIESSDGRRINLYYDGYGHVQTAGSGSQTWTYSYDYPSPTTGTLTGVTLPDGNAWAISFGALSRARFRYYKPQGAGAEEEPYRSCYDPGDIFNPDEYSGTMTHPSGAMAQFTVAPRRFGRSNVPLYCSNFTTPSNNPNDDQSIYSLNWDAYALTRKSVSGPGLEPAAWTYGYSSGWSFTGNANFPVCTQGANCAMPTCLSEGCSGYNVVTVFGPARKVTQYTFGNSYRYNEGKLINVAEGVGDELAGVESLLRSTTTSYEFATSGLPYAAPVGRSLQPRGAGFTSEYPRPERRSSIAQSGETFNREVNSFDSFARPLTVTRWSSLGFTRNERIDYHDNISAWVLGQQRRLLNEDSGEIISEVEFEPVTALPRKKYSFGKLQQVLTYRTDGTLETATDGNNNLTTVSNWKRGIPRHIAYADGTSESAAVNDQGWVTSTTDENGYTTSYEYDAMGRVDLVTYPAEDSFTWNPTATAFGRSSEPRYGLPVGHWQQITTQGNYRKTTYFDGYWRPVVEEEEDVSIGPASRRWVARRYDAAGRLAFESYPRNPQTDGDVAYTAVMNGTRRYYDALDRVTTVEQDSELGVLTTTTQYLPGFLRKTTNPKLQSTTESFQAFDQPDMESPIWIESPEGVSNGIVRDAYSSPMEIIRAGPSG